MAQLVERSQPTPEILSLNSVIANFFTINCIKSVLKRWKQRKKRPGMAIIYITNTNVFKRINFTSRKFCQIDGSTLSWCSCASAKPLSGRTEHFNWFIFYWYWYFIGTLLTLQNWQTIWSLIKAQGRAKKWSGITSFESGQWLRLSWQSGCFLSKRSTVRIQSSANFYNVYCYLSVEKTKIKKKRLEMAHYYKNACLESTYEQQINKTFQLVINW